MRAKLVEMVCRATNLDQCSVRCPFSVSAGGGGGGVSGRGGGGGLRGEIVLQISQPRFTVSHRRRDSAVSLVDVFLVVSLCVCVCVCVCVLFSDIGFDFVVVVVQCCLCVLFCSPFETYNYVVLKEHRSKITLRSSS